MENVIEKASATNSALNARLGRVNNISAVEKSTKTESKKESAAVANKTNQFSRYLEASCDCV